jgi:hypothetical protein
LPKCSRSGMSSTKSLKQVCMMCSRRQVSCESLYVFGPSTSALAWGHGWTNKACSDVCRQHVSTRRSRSPMQVHCNALRLHLLVVTKLVNGIEDRLASTGVTYAAICVHVVERHASL